MAGNEDTDFKHMNTENTVSTQRHKRKHFIIVGNNKRKAGIKLMILNSMQYGKTSRRRREKQENKGK